MSWFLNIFNSASNQIIIFLVSVFSIFLLFSLIFKDSPKKAVKKIRCSFILTLVSNLSIFLLVSRLISKYFKNQASESEVLAFSFLFIFTFILNLYVVLKMKELLPKSKKGGNLLDVFKDISKEIFSNIFDITMIFLILLASLYVLGNGFLDGLLILLICSVVITFLTSKILFPKFLIITEKIFN